MDEAWSSRPRNFCTDTMGESDNSIWIVTAIDMAYSPCLEGKAREEALEMIAGYFEEAKAKGFSQDHARAILGGELRVIMPVAEPLKHVLSRALRKFDY